MCGATACWCEGRASKRSGRAGRYNEAPGSGPLARPCSAGRIRFMNPLVWSVVLLLLGLALLALEVFLPSGGILGFLSISSLIAAVVLAFHRGAQTGFIFLLVA